MKYTISISLLALSVLNCYTYAGDLQSRDLDGDRSTVEAFYFEPLDITWLADANLGLTETFGLERTTIGFYDYRLLVDVDGSMLRGSLDSYFEYMNQSRYLGYSNWRLPIAQGRGDDGCSVQMPAGETNLTWGFGCSGPEVGQFNQYLLAEYGGVENTPFRKYHTTLAGVGWSLRQAPLHLWQQ